MKIKRLVPLLLSAGLISSYAVAGDTVIAVVNVQKVMSESTAVKGVREQLENKYKSFQAEINKKKEPLQKEGQELVKKQGVLAKDAYKEKAKALDKKMTEVQQEAESKKAMLNNASAKSSEEIQKTVAGIVSDIAKDKGYLLVVSTETPTSQVLYADSKIDISDEVVKRLNDKLPKLDAKFEAPAKK